MELENRNSKINILNDILQTTTATSVLEESNREFFENITVKYPSFSAVEEKIDEPEAKKEQETPAEKGESVMRDEHNFFKKKEYSSYGSNKKANVSRSKNSHFEDNSNRGIDFDRSDRQGNNPPRYQQNHHHSNYHQQQQTYQRRNQNSYRYEQRTQIYYVQRASSANKKNEDSTANSSTFEESNKKDVSDVSNEDTMSQKEFGSTRANTPASMTLLLVRF